MQHAFPPRHLHSPAAPVAALDGLRGIAVLMVLLNHLPAPWFHGGRAGVDVFFVLSGFLITTTLLRGFRARGRGEFSSFYFRRVLRLWPPLVPCLLLAGVLWELKRHATPAPDFGQAALAVVFNYANWRDLVEPGSMGILYHAWSLSIEEQFYAVWPLGLWLLMSRGSNPVPLLLGIVGTVWVLRPVAALFTEMDLYNNSLSRMDALLLGCVVALLLDREEARSFWLLRWLRLPAAHLLALAVLAVSLFSRLSLPAYCAMLIPVVALAAAVLVTHAVDGAPGPVRWLLTRAPLTFLGRRSYGLYLYHFPIFYTVNSYRTEPTLANFVAFSLAVVAISIAVASLSFMVEEPLLRWGRAWWERRAQAGVREAAAISPQA